MGDFGRAKSGRNGRLCIILYSHMVSSRSTISLFMDASKALQKHGIHKSAKSIDISSEITSWAETEFLVRSLRSRKSIDPLGLASIMPLIPHPHI